MSRKQKLIPARILSVVCVLLAALAATTTRAACTPPPPGMVGWWKGDGSGADAVAGNNGTLVNCAYTNGVDGLAFAFDPELWPYGTYTGVQIADQPAYALTNSLTIEGWVRPRGDGYCIFFRGDNRPGLDPYALGMQGNHTMLFGISDAIGNNTQLGTTLAYNAWTHLGATLDGGTGTMSLYTNGVLAAQTTTAVRPFGALVASDSPGIGIGNVNDGFNNFPFYGDMDEIALYNRALTPAEIAAIYNAGSAGKCTSTPVVAAVPAIYNLLPALGTNGTLVTISGTNFKSAAASNIVYFGAVRANVLSASANTLTVAVPAGSTFGPVTVTVGGLTAYSGQRFEPTFIGSGSNVTASSFAPSFNLGTSNGPLSSVIADLDGDGKPDILLVNYYSPSVSIFRNISTNGAPLGAASFGPPVNLSFPTNGIAGSPYQICAVDLDGDGKLDLVATEMDGNRVSVFHNVATPGTLTTNSFEPPFALIAGNSCVFATAADLDSDGRVDIVAANYGANSISVFKNIGTAGSLTPNSFAPPIMLATPAGPIEVAIADLDGDGKPDLATANNNGGGTVSIFQNITASGGISTNSFAPRFDMGAGSGTLTIVALDLDGDGKLDLAAGSAQSDYVSVFRNVSSAGMLTTNSFAPRVDFGTPGWMHSIAVADFNGDGKPDLGVVGELGSYMAIFQNVSTPGSFTTASFAPRVDFGTGWNAWGIAAGDLDGDGRPDIVFCNFYDGNIQIYQNIMPFGSPVPPPPNCTPAPSGLVGWWKAEGNANDTFGSNNGALSASGAAYASGEVGQGFRFDGTNGYVQIPDSDALKPVNVTCEAWVWLDPSLPSGRGGEQIVFKKNTWSAWFEGYSLIKVSIDNGNGTYSDRFQFCVSSHGNQVAINSQTIAQRGVWYHVAATYDGNQSILYVNGVAEVSATPGFALDYDTTPVFIGTSGTWPPYLSMFGGIIDEISIYSRALSSNEIAAIYNAGSGGKCPPFAPPVIVNQPVSQTNLLGSTAVFSVAASGTQPLAYQWTFNGTNIFAATNSSLTLPNVQPNQTGNYAVLVTNLFGSATSSNASLIVIVPAIPPTIVSQTPSQIVLLGSTVTFGVSVSGSPPLGYLWGRDGALIENATNSSFTLFNAQLADSGSRFSCLVTNAFGYAISTNATLKVLDTVSNDLCSGAVVVTSATYTNYQSTLKASAFGDPTPDCVAGFGHGVWYRFTAPVAGRLIVDTFGSDFDTGLAIYTGTCDALTEVACNDDFAGVNSQVTLPTATSTTYFILVGGYASDAGNLVLHLNHLTPPVFDVQPTNLFVVVSSNAVFNPTVSGTLPITFQWYFNNTALADGGRISGSTSATLNIANVRIQDGGYFFLVASNFIGVTTSSVAVLTPVILPPTITTPPVSQSVLTGSNVNFFAVVSGTPPYAYQWSLNGNPLAEDGVHVTGSQTSSLNISNLTTADAGTYTLTVTNVSGSDTASATLVVMVPPQITLNPIGRSVPPGLPTIFNAVASGIPAPSYQWQLNGANIPGATFANYTNAAIGSNDIGYYQVVATNAVGSATSVVAQLTFGPVAAWGRNLNNECLPPPNLSNVVAVAGTAGASYAVKADGSVVAWGKDSATNVPAGATNVVYLASSDGVTVVALRADGTIVGLAGSAVPAVSNIVAVSSTTSGGVALRAEGTIVTWGSFSAPAGLNKVKAVASGFRHHMAVRDDGTVVAWGTGLGTNVPAGLSGVVALAAGYDYSLALKADGRVVAWGTGISTNLPAGLTNVIAICSSAYASTSGFNLAIRSDGTVLAWGFNSYGQTNPPTGLSNLVTSGIGASLNHGLALVSDGSPQILQPPVGLTAYVGRDVTLSAKAAGAAPLSYQWLLNGTNVPNATNRTLFLPAIQSPNAGNYQLFVSNAIATAISLPAPVNVISNSTLTFLSQSSVSASNVYQGGKVTFYAGAVLGNGPLSYQWFFSPTNKNYTAVPGATNDTLPLDPALAGQSGNYYVTVSNQFGGLTNAPVAVRVMFAKAWGNLATDPPFNMTNATAIAVGNYGAGSTPIGDYFALSAAGKISSWSGGSVGYGETNFSTLSNSIVTAIAAGYADTLALKSDGTVFAAGYNVYGETNVPAATVGITAIACGDYHDLALKSDGTVIGWGQNTYSQATNAAATNVVAIAAGGQNSIALRADGSVTTWGNYGQFPPGQYPVPVNATNVVAVAAGGSHFLALRANGTVVGWGYNPSGQTTIPASWSNIVAIAAGASHSTALRNDGTVLTVGSSYSGFFSNYVPSDLANVIAIACSGDHDLGLFGTRAPAFTVQPWNRSLVIGKTVTNVTLAGKCAGVQPMSYQWRLNGTNYPGGTNDSLTLQFDGKISQIQPGTYQLVASNSYGVAISKPAKISIIIPLGDAVDATNLTWTTSGSAPWYGETNITHDGVDAARSGGIGSLQESILQTTLGTNTAGTVTFWWKVSSEQYFDTLEFRVNGLVQGIISGEADWQLASFPISAGTNVLMWRYSKDATFDSGLDAGFVDQFSFTAAPVLLRQPASVTANQGTTVYLAVTAAGSPTIGYQWTQNGNPVGSNNSILMLNNVGRAQDGSYCVTVTNAGGAVVSSNAIVHVNVPQLLGTPVLLPDGSLQFTSTDLGGGTLSPSDLPNFEAQASTDLVHWITLPNALSLANGRLQLSDPARTNFAARYYRIIEH